VHGEMMKEEALKLADELQKHFNCYNEYSDMIRRLIEELDKQKETIRNLNKTLGFVNSGYEVINLEPQTKPLTDDEILDMSDDYIANQFELAFEGDKLVEYVRAVMKKANER
jgi:transcription antitermination factor NusG